MFSHVFIIIKGTCKGSAVWLLKMRQSVACCELPAEKINNHVWGKSQLAIEGAENIENLFVEGVIPTYKLVMSRNQLLRISILLHMLHACFWYKWGCSIFLSAFCWNLRGQMVSWSSLIRRTPKLKKKIMYKNIYERKLFSHVIMAGTHIKT